MRAVHRNHILLRIYSMADFDEDLFAPGSAGGEMKRHKRGSKSNPLQPPVGLERGILRRVQIAKRRALVLKTAGFGALFIGSISMLVMSYFNLIAAFSQSGFLDFASLFFSDFGTAMANFQDFAFSILESFPTFSSAFLLGGIIVAIWSAAHVIDDISLLRGYRKFS